MKKKILFLVEGKADAKFLIDYINFLFEQSNSSLLKEISKNKNKNKNEIKYENKNYDIVIFIMGGCTKFENLKQQITRHKDDKYSILIIHDADNPRLNNISATPKNAKYLKIKVL